MRREYAITQSLIMIMYDVQSHYSNIVFPIFKAAINLSHEKEQAVFTPQMTPCSAHVGLKQFMVCVPRVE